MSWFRKRIGHATVKYQPEKVVGKARHRMTPGTMRSYTPKETVAAEEEIAWLFRARYGGRYSNHAGEVRMRVDYWRKLAKSNPKKWEGQSDLKKPDVDNVLKLVMDALNGVAYVDDSQVTCAVVCKHPRRPFRSGNRMRISIDYYEETYR